MTAIFPYTSEASEHVNLHMHYCQIEYMTDSPYCHYIVLFLCCLLVFSSILAPLRKTRRGKNEKEIVSHS